MSFVADGRSDVVDLLRSEPGSKRYLTVNLTDEH